MRGFCKTVLFAVGLVLCLSAAAAALPGDPPVELRAPAAGAEVAARADGVTVSFTCPPYRQEIYGDPTDPTVSTGGPDDYQVRFSDSAELGPDGVLSAQPYGSDATARDAGDGTCTAQLDTYDSAASPEVTGGRVYWQVRRSCPGCEGQQPETSSVGVFDIRATIQARLSVPRRTWVGCLSEWAVVSAAPLGGARVLLQRRAGSTWRTFAEEAFLSDRKPLFVRLPAGRHRVRAVIRTRTSSAVVASDTVTVRRQGVRQTSGRDSGRYRNADRTERNTLQLDVGSGGRTIRTFRATVTTFCFGATLADNRLYVATALLRGARVAPDGTVLAVLRSSAGGREVLRGRLRARRFSGSIDVSLSTCNGRRAFVAVRG